MASGRTLEESKESRSCSLFDFQKLVDLTVKSRGQSHPIGHHYAWFPCNKPFFIHIYYNNVVESGYKVHFNFEHIRLLEKAWNVLTPLFFAPGSPVQMMKFAIPDELSKYERENRKLIADWEENKTNTPGAIQESKIVLDEDMIRRYGATQITFYLSCPPGTSKEAISNGSIQNVDWFFYVKFFYEAETLLRAAGITPGTFTPTGDTQLGEYLSIRQDRNSKGEFIRWSQALPPAPFIVDFVKKYKIYQRIQRVVAEVFSGCFSGEFYHKICPLVDDFFKQIDSLQSRVPEVVEEKMENFKTILSGAKLAGDAGLVADYLHVFRQRRQAEEKSVLKSKTLFASTVVTTTTSSVAPAKR